LKSTRRVAARERETTVDDPDILPTADVKYLSLSLNYSRQPGLEVCPDHRRDKDTVYCVAP
jgi:hypothetical protein